jgi:beta-lactamase regulating signal transducer with metallopeptidase domain
MANWSQSHFLQSLGWATINSFWQMALLWCLYLGASHFFRISSARKYQLSVIAILAGFNWFIITFLYYYNSSQVATIAFFSQAVDETNSLLNMFLLSASLTYLLLLVFPSWKLYRNWQFVQTIKRDGLVKADFNYRLFVQRITSQLGITRKVTVYVSQIARSPLTVGYFKPVILLPIAALNNLSTQQVEAILLHELSHIRRYDYLVNFMISIISTVLYFNPFVKMFMRQMEEERENCCDQLVLQYGYDKLGYATALLTLEKLSVNQQVLALAAAGKNFLLNRIEKIVGLEKKKGFRKNHLAGMLAALFCIVVFNSVLIIRETKKQQPSGTFAFDSMGSPFSLYENNRGFVAASPSKKAKANETAVKEKIVTGAEINPAPFVGDVAQHPFAEASPKAMEMYSFIALDAVDASLTKEQKEEVKTTVENTRKVISGLQWNEIEKVIADVLSEKEKMQAKKEYLKALEQAVDFKKLEQNLKAQYQVADLARINYNLDKALATIQLDSVQKSYESILVQLEKATEACLNPEVAASPMPDQSLEALERSTEELRKRIDTIKLMKSPKKVVRL